MDSKVSSLNDNNEYDPYILSLSDETGKEYQFEVLDDIDYEDNRYLALQPVYDDPKKMLDESGELVILKAIEDENGDETFDEIQDDNEYEEVANIFMDRLQDLFDINEK